MSSLKFSHLSAGFIAVLVGFTSSVAIIFQAAESLGANQAQLNSWMLALGIGMGASSIILSLKFRMPIITAWSTPGAALLVTSLEGVSMSDAIGSFMLSGALILLFGIAGWFEKVQRLIPSTVANAMLAGILLQFGLSIFHSIQNQTLLVSIMLASYLVGKRYLGNFNIPSVFAIGIITCLLTGMFNTQPIIITFASPVWTQPSISLTTIISVAIPLFIVTMTSQNLPGAATLKAAGYQAPLSASLKVTGLCTMLLAPFGGFSFNLAAITAAICCARDVDENPNTRYLAAIATGGFYIVIGLFGATVVSLFFIAPKALVSSIAGLALLTTLANSLKASLSDDYEKEAALITFLVTVSGISFFSIGSAFWGLLMGMCTLAISKKT